MTLPPILSRSMRLGGPDTADLTGRDGAPSDRVRSLSSSRPPRESRRCWWLHGCEVKGRSEGTRVRIRAPRIRVLAVPDRAVLDRSGRLRRRRWWVALSSILLLQSSSWCTHHLRETQELLNNERWPSRPAGVTKRVTKFFVWTTSTSDPPA